MYVDLNELKIQRECQCSAKRTIQLLLPIFSSAVFLYTSVSLCFPLPTLCLTPITHTLKTSVWFDRRHIDLPPPASVSCLWRTRRVVLSPAILLHPCSVFIYLFSLFSTATVLLFFLLLICGVGGIWMILFVFFISDVGEKLCENCFPSFRLNRAHPMVSCPPSLPLLSLTLFSPFPPAPFVSVCVHSVNHCQLLITNTVHSLSRVGKDNSIFLCALGNLYNSILNLNETIKMMLRNNAREMHSWRPFTMLVRILKMRISVSLFFCISFIYLFCFIFAGFSGG